MYNFKKFESLNARYEDRITVTSSNSFGFPTRFYQKNGLEKFRYVVLYFDQTEYAVGFHFTDDENEKHKFAMLKSKKGYGGSIVATSFFKTHQIQSSQYKGRYDWEKQTIDGIGEVYIIKLKLTGVSP